MKFDRKTLKGFGAGLLAAAVIAGTGLPARALSALEEIKVYRGGINLFIDGKLQVPTDVNGNEVEPFIYAGTTYLPVRALTGMLTDKAVEWDANTESVYIGLKPGAGEVVRAEKLTVYNSDTYYVAYTGESAQFKVLNETYTPFNRFKLYDSFNNRHSITVDLDSMYTELNGEFVIPYSQLGSKNAGKLCIYAVDQYGTENLIDSYELKAGDDPVSVHTNVRGCEFLTIKLERASIDDYSGNGGQFYNVTFTKAAAG